MVSKYTSKLYICGYFFPASYSYKFCEIKMKRDYVFKDIINYIFHIKIDVFQDSTRNSLRGCLWINKGGNHTKIKNKYFFEDNKTETKTYKSTW